MPADEFVISKTDFARAAHEWFENLGMTEVSQVAEKAAFLRLVTTEVLFLKLLVEAHPELESEVRPRMDALVSFPNRLIDFQKVWPANAVDSPDSKAMGAEFDQALTDLALGKEVFTDEN